MRLREIQALLHANVPKLREYASAPAMTVDQNAALQISNLSAYRAAVLKLSEIPALRPHINTALHREPGCADRASRMT